MTIREYHDKSRDTANYAAGISYPLLGLLGEVGELAGQVAKMERDDGGKVTPERRMNLVKEVGDVMWMCAALAHETGATLDEAIRCGDFATLGKRHTIHGHPGTILANMTDDVWRIMRAAGEAGWRQEFRKNGIREVRYAIEKVMDSVSDFAAYYGISLHEAAVVNIDKLADRKARGVIAGSGDDR